MIRRTAALLAGGFLVAACGNSGGSSELGSPLGLTAGIYVGTDYNSVMMLNLTDNGHGQYSGSMNGKDQGQAPVTATATATVTGSKVTLVVSGAFSSQATTTGTIQGRELHLQVPQANGTIEDYVLHPGTVDEYNTDITNLG